LRRVRLAFRITFGADTNNQIASFKTLYLSKSMGRREREIADVTGRLGLLPFRLHPAEAVTTLAGWRRQSLFLDAWISLQQARCYFQLVPDMNYVWPRTCVRACAKGAEMSLDHESATIKIAIAQRSYVYAL
jgi:hypothetical protein